jgi:hypothetical protein
MHAGKEIHRENGLQPLMIAIRFPFQWISHMKATNSSCWTVKTHSHLSKSAIRSEKGTTSTIKEVGAICPCASCPALYYIRMFPPFRPQQACPGQSNGADEFERSRYLGIELPWLTRCWRGNPASAPFSVVSAELKMELAREREHRETAERQFGEEQKIRCEFLLDYRTIICLLSLQYIYYTASRPEIRATKKETFVYAKLTATVCWNRITYYR